MSLDSLIYSSYISSRMACVNLPLTFVSIKRYVPDKFCKFSYIHTRFFPLNQTGQHSIYSVFQSCTFRNVKILISNIQHLYQIMNANLFMKAYMFRIVTARNYCAWGIPNRNIDAIQLQYIMANLARSDEHIDGYLLLAFEYNPYRCKVNVAIKSISNMSGVERLNRCEVRSLGCIL